MDAMTGFIGVPSSVWIRALLIVVESPPIYIGLLGFSIAAALILSFIAAWQYTASRGGKKL